MNKLVLLSLLIVSLTVTSFYFFQPFQTPANSDQKVETIFNRSGLKKHTLINNQKTAKLQSASDLNILTYNINVGVSLEENDSAGKVEKEQKTDVNTQAHVNVEYDSQNKKFYLIVAYSKYSQETMIDDENKNQKLQEPTNFNEITQNTEQYNYQNTLVYKLIVDEYSGEILNIQAPSNDIPNKLMQWTTQELVNNIFPDLRTSVFKGKAPVEQDSIGTFQPHIVEIQVDDDVAQIQKTFDSKDYSNLNVDNMVPPESSYQRNLYIDVNSGVVLGGGSQYEFSIGGNDSNTMKSDGQVILETNVASLDIGIQTYFYLQQEDQHTKEQSNNLFNFIEQSEIEFIEVELTYKEKGENLFDLQVQEEKEESVKSEIIDESNVSQQIIDQIFDSEEIQQQISEAIEEQSELLQQNQIKLSANYNSNTTLISFSVLSQNVTVEISVQVQNVSASVNAYAKVNGKIIKTLYSKTVSYCINYSQDFPLSISIPLFYATWPVGGLITIPVSATASFHAGFKITAKDAGSSCTASASPYFRAELLGEGKASLAGVISAGLYAKGTFLNSSLSLGASLIKSSKKIEASFKGYLTAVGFEFGCCYNMISCDVGKIFKFEWKNTCTLGKTQYKPFITQSTNSISKTYWAQTLYQ